MWRTSRKEESRVGCVAVVDQWSTLGHRCLKVQHLLPFEGSAVRLVIEHGVCGSWTGSRVIGTLSIALRISALQFQVVFSSGQGNMQGCAAHLWASIKPAWILRERTRREETLSARFWWMSLPLLFYSVVANITDSVSWKEFVLALRCETHIDYRAPRVSYPWQGWYWPRPDLAVKYGCVLPNSLHLNYLYNGQMILSGLQARTSPLDPLASIKSFISYTSEEKQVHLDYELNYPNPLHPGWNVLGVIRFSPNELSICGLS